MTCNCNDPIDVPSIPSVQPIYPYCINPCATKGCSFTIAPHTCYVFPFRLCPGAIVQSQIIHTGRVQDRSLRAWISSIPLGQSITQLTYNLSFWEPNRTGKQIISIYDREIPPPCGGTAMIATDPGVLYLNVLNLINSSNQFSQTLTQCTPGGSS